MVGNSQCKETIGKLLERVQVDGEVPFPFVIVEEQEGVGAMAWLEGQLGELVWGYQQDVLVLRNLVSDLGKKRHEIRVSVKPADQTIDSQVYGPSKDRGAREMISRLALAPAGKVKIVLIEQIERMNRSAANAMLKSFEEPQPWRLIMATTRSAWGLLDTIRSRAFVIRTVPPTLEQLSENITKKYWQIDQKWILSRCVALSRWDETLAESLLSGDREVLMVYGQLEQELFATVSPVDWSWWWVSHRIAKLAWELIGTQVWGYTLTWVWLLEALTLRASHEWHIWLVDSLLTARKLIGANVKAEHVWYGLGV